MNKKYIVRLTEEEQNRLHSIIAKGTSAAYRIKHAHILLSADVNGLNRPDTAIAQTLSTSPNTVKNVRQRFVEQGFQAALGQKLLDGRKEAK